MDEVTLLVLRYSLSVTAFVTLSLHWKFFWNERRLFPCLPLFLSYKVLPVRLVRLQFLSALGVLIGIGIGSQSIVPYLSLFQLIWGLIWCIIDENIWCPQIAHFNMIAASICFSDVTSLKIWTISLYFFGGIQKLNYKFIKDGRGFIDFLNPLLMKRNIQLEEIFSEFYLEIAAVLTGMVEVLIGLGLLLSSTQMICSILSIGLHVTILLCVGPLGANNYHGIWAWNLMCIFITPALFFIPSQESPFMEIYVNLIDLRVLCWISLLLWGIFPLLNLINGYWPDSLAFKLHSYNFPRLNLQVLGKNITLPEVFERFMKESGIIDTNRLAAEYSNTPCCSCRGGVSWGQHLADLSGYSVLVDWKSSPCIYNGKRTLYRYVCKPFSSPTFLGTIVEGDY